MRVVVTGATGNVGTSVVSALAGDARVQEIVGVLVGAFDELMRADPVAFRRKFRKMAAEPFAFYRGTACLFYADMAHDPDPWSDERTSRVWIQGDLHAENFGTYMGPPARWCSTSTTSTRPTSAASPGTSSGWPRASR